MVSERGLEVLRVIVHDFVANREPVGSKSIVDRHSFGVSAATIRNDMAQLEEEELIAAPHTSSGRVPTDKGYRLFVDQLADRRPLSAAQRRAIEEFLDASLDFDDVLNRTARALSRLTNQVAIVQYPSFARALVRHVEVIVLAPVQLLVIVITDRGQVEQRRVELDDAVDAESIDRIKRTLNGILIGAEVSRASTLLAGLVAELPPGDAELAARIAEIVVEQLAAYRQDRLVLAGAANLARTEEDFTGSIFPVLEALEEQVVLLKLFAEMEMDPSGVTSRIGRENASFGLGETSVLAGGYHSSSGEIARVGVLGPTRMDYQSNMAAVRAVARYLSRLLGEA